MEKQSATNANSTAQSQPKLDNKAIYKKTIIFSVHRLLWDIASFIVFFIICAVAFFIAESTTNKGLIGLAIGLIIGIIFLAVVMRYISYSYKAGQIAMMTKGIVEDKLPEDTLTSGKQIVKKRFTTVAAYFAVTNVIKGIFSQIGNAITSVGQAIGGDNGNAIGSTISSIIQTIVNYLCDCCLGWVFYREDEKSSKATCEGAVLFFKHGKTLAKNLGRVFGMGILSFIVIAGIITGISFLICQLFPDFFSQLSAEIIEAAARAETELPSFFSDVNSVMLIFSAIIGISLWSMIHSAFIRPFVLVGVLRNYINSGIDHIPTEESFKELDAKSTKFKKLHSEL